MAELTGLWLAEGHQTIRTNIWYIFGTQNSILSLIKTTLKKNICSGTVHSAQPAFSYQSGAEPCLGDASTPLSGGSAHPRPTVSDTYGLPETPSLGPIALSPPNSR